jgi:hypothetical protein
MTYDFRKSHLWESTLAPRSSDKYSVQRAKLNAAYESMRDNASQLVALIRRDCPGLTVHDVSHLDALWEMADLIAGEGFVLTPAEAFVFGASILIHDSAMTVAAYPGRLAEIMKTTDWADTLFAAFRQNYNRVPTTNEISSPPKEIESTVLFAVLRALHAKQTETLATIAWKVPSTGNTVVLMEDLGLREAYGRAIGRIAHSHHWELDRLQANLRPDGGVAVGLPGEWTLNEIKVACLLRCADAAHLDQRRAPSVEYALTTPSYPSDTHWNYQNKLNAPTRHQDALRYASGQDFLIQDARAWWMCYDAIKVLNRELVGSNALLRDTGISEFAAVRVFGAESPAILSTQIVARDWKPVDAEVRVSSPTTLAQTLGGVNLYGHGLYAPIRELLQNSIDAVRARRLLEDREETWGQIRVTLELSGEGSDYYDLHVDDNGIGMSNVC